MRKQKRQLNPAPKNLKEFFNSYEPVTLVAMLQTLENSTGWGLFQAYSSFIQRKFEVDSLDLLGKGENIAQATYASGYAKACEEMSKSFMEGLRQTALNISPVVENPREEEKEPKTQYD